MSNENADSCLVMTAAMQLTFLLCCAYMVHFIKLQPVLQEATLAVADVEKKRGEKRKRQYLHHTRRNGNVFNLLPLAKNDSTAKIMYT